VPESRDHAHIYVLAGTNGAGKSSVGGAMITSEGVRYFNPDQAAQKILAANSEISIADANSAAWHEGTRLLKRAIQERLDYAFETTLGGRTITEMLEQALLVGAEVHMWYVGLATPELHVARVQVRVSRGGHDISENKIRERYDSSRYNLIRLLPRLTELWLYDNSEEADPVIGATPEPQLILHMEAGQIIKMSDPRAVPAWAKSIVAVAVQFQS
jgi:predicted ABC-type ATPase